MGTAIKILDKDNKVIGELMTATTSDIDKFINKGLKVIDINTGQEITGTCSNTDTFGVSDGFIDIG